MAQLSSTMVQQGVSARTRTRSVALGAVYGTGFAYVASAVVAVWAAYDGRQALLRFFLLLTGVLGLMVAPMLPATSLRRTAGFILGLPSLLLLIVSLAYGSQRLEMLSGYLPMPLSDNLASSIIVIGLPFAFAALWLGVAERRVLPGLTGALALVVGLAALALTGSRGAWIGLTAGAVIAGYLLIRHGLVERRGRRPAWLLLADIAIVLVFLGAIVFYAAIILSPELDGRLGISAQGGSALSRMALWRDSLPLIQDYYFTGSGLAATAMTYATYAYLLHVPYLFHAHNLYLQVALEQGVPGLIAFVGIFAAAVLYSANAWQRADRTGRALLAAGYAATAALLVHGLFDAELYFSLLAPIVFLAPALLLWSASSVYRQARGDDHGEVPASGGMVGLAMGFGLPLLVALLMPGAPARWEANLGAVLQSRAELGIYRQPEWSFQDQVRRQLPQDLAAAESHFQTALALDPGQPTANRRLGQIAMARSNFAVAENYLSTAHAVQPAERVARQLLGELAALKGDTAGAVAMWQGLDFSQSQLMVRGWWYEYFGEKIQLERFNNAVQAFERAQ